jgi:hypothetical protein
VRWNGLHSGVSDAQPCAAAEARARTSRYRGGRNDCVWNGGPDRTRICDLYRVKVAL